MMGDVAVAVNGDGAGVAGSQVLEVMGTAFRASERLLVARA